MRNTENHFADSGAVRVDQPSTSTADDVNGDDTKVDTCHGTEQPEIEVKSEKDSTQEQHHTDGIEQPEIEVKSKKDSTQKQHHTDGTEQPEIEVKSQKHSTQEQRHTDEDDEDLMVFFAEFESDDNEGSGEEWLPVDSDNDDESGGEEWTPSGTQGLDSQGQHMETRTSNAGGVVLFDANQELTTDVLKGIMKVVYGVSDPNESTLLMLKEQMEERPRLKTKLLRDLHLGHSMFKKRGKNSTRARDISSDKSPDGNETPSTSSPYRKVQHPSDVPSSEPSSSISPSSSSSMAASQLQASRVTIAGGIKSAEASISAVTWSPHQPLTLEKLRAHLATKHQSHPMTNNGPIRLVPPQTCHLINPRVMHTIPSMQSQHPGTSSAQQFAQSTQSVQPNPIPASQLGRIRFIDNAVPTPHAVFLPQSRTVNIPELKAGPPGSMDVLVPVDASGQMKPPFVGIPLRTCRIEFTPDKSEPSHEQSSSTSAPVHQENPPNAVQGAESLEEGRSTSILAPCTSTPGVPKSTAENINRNLNNTVQSAQPALHPQTTANSQPIVVNRNTPPGMAPGVLPSRVAPPVLPPGVAPAMLPPGVAPAVLPPGILPPPPSLPPGTVPPGMVPIGVLPAGMVPGGQIPPGLLPPGVVTVSLPPRHTALVGAPLGPFSRLQVPNQQACPQNQQPVQQTRCMSPKENTSASSVVNNTTSISCVPTSRAYQVDNSPVETSLDNSSGVTTPCVPQLEKSGEQIEILNVHSLSGREKGRKATTKSSEKEAQVTRNGVSPAPKVAAGQSDANNDRSEGHEGASTSKLIKEEPTSPINESRPEGNCNHPGELLKVILPSSARAHYQHLLDPSSSSSNLQKDQQEISKPVSRVDLGLLWNEINFLRSEMQFIKTSVAVDIHEIKAEIEEFMKMVAERLGIRSPASTNVQDQDHNGNKRKEKEQENEPNKKRAKVDQS
ncbi:uncharacterized protein [Diadema antillarum]|uniref:uncharacterized protein n=1 Tax=Diadema antillarum TaxID=105358 RepID=UPI003A83E059